MFLEEKKQIVSVKSAQGHDMIFNPHGQHRLQKTCNRYHTQAAVKPFSFRLVRQM